MQSAHARTCKDDCIVAGDGKPETVKAVETPKRKQRPH